MKKLVLTLCLMAGFVFASNAQRFAMVDMEYIMRNIPRFESAEEQLNQISRRWQAEVETMMQEVQQMYRNYQTELVFLSDEMRRQREEEIIAKERAANELRRRYFGQDGELFQMRANLMRPIQEDIYTALQEIINERGLDMVFDRSSAMHVIIAAPRLDISDEVLRKLGYAR